MAKPIDRRIALKNVLETLQDRRERLGEPDTRPEAQTGRRRRRKDAGITEKGIEILECFARAPERDIAHGRVYLYPMSKAQERAAIQRELQRQRAAIARNAAQESTR